MSRSFAWLVLCSLVLALLLTLGCQKQASETSEPFTAPVAEDDNGDDDEAMAEGDEEIEVAAHVHYYCEMDPEETADEPGTCPVPVCGMDLIENPNYDPEAAKPEEGAEEGGEETEPESEPEAEPEPE